MVEIERKLLPGSLFLKLTDFRNILIIQCLAERPHGDSVMLKQPFLHPRRFLVITGTCVLSIAVLSGAGESTPRTVDISRRISAMGTTLEMRISATDRETALKASEALVAAVESVETRLSTWRPDSELSRLNGAAQGIRVDISSKLESDLREAGHWWMETEAAFDPGIGSLVTVWDVRGGGRSPSRSELNAALDEAGYENLVLNPDSATRLASGFGVEEGAFGKGVALREASTAALATGATCVVVNFGGQIEVRGACPVEVISVADPWDRARVSAVLRLPGGSVATSGNSERGNTVDGNLIGHLLDPRTGLPVLDWGSVTVVADDAVAADCVATALYVMGPQRGKEWLRERTGLEAVFVENVEKTTTVSATEGLKGHLSVIGADDMDPGVLPVIAWLNSFSE